MAMKEDGDDDMDSQFLYLVPEMGDSSEGVIEEFLKRK